MSQINDALKRAKKMQQPDLPTGAAPLPPIESSAPQGIGWLFPAVIIFLIAAACFFIGLAFAARTPARDNTATAPQTNAVKPSTPGK